MHAHPCICTPKHAHTQVYTYISMHTFACTRTHKHETGLHKYKCTRKSMQTSICTHTQMHMNASIQIHTQTQTQAHSFTQLLRKVLHYSNNPCLTLSEIVFSRLLKVEFIYMQPLTFLSGS